MGVAPSSSPLFIEAELLRPTIVQAEARAAVEVAPTFQPGATVRVRAREDKTRGGLMQTFRATARPLAVDQTKEAALWNALCPLGGDDFLVVSQYRDQICLTRGTVRAKSAR